MVVMCEWMNLTSPVVDY